MKRLTGFLAIILLVTACGNSTRDLAGVWVFSDLKFDEKAPQMDPFELEQTKDLFRDMTYRFIDDTHFSLVTPNLNDDTLKGTYTLENGGDELVLTFKNDKKRFLIKKLKERELILEEIGTKEGEKVEFIYTR